MRTKIKIKRKIKTTKIIKNKIKMKKNLKNEINQIITTLKLESSASICLTFAMMKELA